MLRRTAVIAALALVVQVPGDASLLAHSKGERLDHIEAEIRHKRYQIRAANRREQGLLSQLATSDARRESLARSISDLALALRRARDRLAETRAALAASQVELRRWKRRLARMEGKLQDQRSTLGRRAATAYKMGAGGYLDVVFGATDLRSLTDRVEFANRVLVADSGMVRGVEVSTGLVAAHRGRVGRFRRQLDSRALRLNGQIARIGALKAEKEALRIQVDREIEVRQGLVDDVQGEKAAYRRAVRELEAESLRVRGVIQGGGSHGSGSGQLSWPASGPVVSGFGWRTHPIFGTKRFHAGIDIDGSCGQRISAAAGGRVLSSGWSGGYGKTIVLDHGDGLSTLYAHMSKLSASSGARVSRGERIGSIGTTGWSTGCHLHFEVRVNGEPVDPMRYL